MFGQPDAVKQQWAAHFPDAERPATASAAAGARLSAPQHLPIRTALAQLQTELDDL